MCVCGLYIYFFGLSYCCFFGWHCCLRGVLFFIWGWGGWFWIDFGGVFFWGGGSGEGWKIMFRISVICHQCEHDYQNNSYCILIVITWYLLHRSMYELLIEFVVSSESHFRKWKKKTRKNYLYLYINMYIGIITTSWSHGVSTILGLLTASLLTFYHNYI